MTWTKHGTNHTFRINNILCGEIEEGKEITSYWAGTNYGFAKTLEEAKLVVEQILGEKPIRTGQEDDVEKVLNAGNTFALDIKNDGSFNRFIIRDVVLLLKDGSELKTNLIRYRQEFVV